MINQACSLPGLGLLQIFCELAKPSAGRGLSLLVMCTDWQLPLSILHVDAGLWEHEVCRAARRHMWSMLAMRIPRSVDLAKVIDTWASLRLLKSKLLSRYERGVFAYCACKGHVALWALVFAHQLALCAASLKHQQHIRNRFRGEAGPVELLAGGWPSAQSRQAVQPENQDLLQWRLTLGEPQVTAPFTQLQHVHALVRRTMQARNLMP